MTDHKDKAERVTFHLTCKTNMTNAVRYCLQGLMTQQGLNPDDLVCTVAGDGDAARIAAVQRYDVDQWEPFAFACDDGKFVAYINYAELEKENAEQAATISGLEADAFYARIDNANRDADD